MTDLDIHDISPLAPGLYIVPTPIGNLRDITLRALDVLHAADIIAAEDTRVTGKLTRHYGIGTRLVAYHEHNEKKMRHRIEKAIRDGQAVALVSDAGTPLISDPGWPLVQEMIAAGHTVTALPGANAVLPALALSGLPANGFAFFGFPPAKSGKRKRFFEDAQKSSGSLLFYEAPQRLAASLDDMHAVFGPRRAAVARELSKLHEEVRRDSLDALAAYYAKTQPRGEIVVIIGPAEAGEGGMSDAEIDALLIEKLAEGLPVKHVAESTAAETGQSKRDLYQRTLALKKADD